jgi:hypothetical protein
MQAPILVTAINVTESVTDTTYVISARTWIACQFR